MSACVSCRAQLPNDTYVRCEGCRSARARSERARAAKRVIGVCADCRIKLRQGDVHLRCEDCRAIRARNARRYRKSARARALNAAWQKASYWKDPVTGAKRARDHRMKQKLANKCTDCVNWAREDSNRCGYCTARRADADRRHRARNTRQP